MMIPASFVLTSARRVRRFCCCCEGDGDGEGGGETIRDSKRDMSIKK
jgi:hypothetical protein